MFHCKRKLLQTKATFFSIFGARCLKVNYKRLTCNESEPSCILFYTLFPARHYQERYRCREAENSGYDADESQYEDWLMRAGYVACGVSIVNS